MRSSKGIENTAYFEEDVFGQAEIAYLSGLSSLDELRPPPAKLDVAAGSVIREAPLPKVSLSEFSGSYLEWESFRDAFESIVVNRPDVPEVQKLILLKRAFKGEAALLVRNIASTAANLSGAWQAVCSRYTNKRLLINAHLTALFELPSVSRESASEMRALLDRVREELRALHQLERPVEYWDDLIVFMLLRHLDTNTRREWELRLTTTDAQKLLVAPEYLPNQPTFAQFQLFLESRIRALEMSVSSSPVSIIKDPEPRKQKTRRSYQVSVRHENSRQSRTSCHFCEGNHSNYSCFTFRQKNPQERLNEVKRLRLCFNCLGAHRQKSCKSSTTCSTCKRPHNSLLHYAFMSASVPVETTAVGSPREDSPQLTLAAVSSDAVLSHHARDSSTRFTDLLTTALVTVVSPEGERFQVRALLDSGSEVSFVSDSVLQRLRLSKFHSPVRVVGVGASSSISATSRVKVAFESRLTVSSLYAVNAFVLPQLTYHIPPRKVSPLNSVLLKGFELADPMYYCEQKIDLILGSHIYGSLLRPGMYAIPDSRVVAVNTSLGWVLTGTLETPNIAPVSSFHCHLVDDLDVTLRRFWELEEIALKELHISPDEQECEDHFRSTHSRDDSGRFVVRLPRRSEIEHVDNREQAVRSLLALERRLSSDESLRAKYVDFMQEYEILGHMEKATAIPITSSWFLPHHAVLSGPQGKKLRVVFDASRKNSQGRSLNQALHQGPRLQNDLSIVFINWRNYRFAFCADIIKMFRQILVHPADRDLQRIVWRADPSNPIADYRLSTVTYGTTCAPYMAICVLRELANVERERFPLGAEYLDRDSYVDDILSGADSIANALTHRNELIELLACAQFKLGKWSANCTELLKQSNADVIESDCTPGNIDLSESTKMLGIYWNPYQDEISFTESVSNLPSTSPITKRMVLSQVSQLFDPLGWISPVVVVAKILLQDLWLSRIDWDAPLDFNLEHRWLDFIRNLVDLNTIRIPRWTQFRYDSEAERHGFADASTRSYAAVIYLRSITEDGSIQTSILISKTKIAPVKTISLPRLELCAAQLLVRLFKHVLQSECFASLPRCAWSDSTVTLAWIRSHPSRWKTFVANRVSFIQTSLPELIWRHVPGSDNPADIASRGAEASTLAVSPLWWSGPAWLRESSEKWPSPPSESPVFSDEEASQKFHSLSGQVETEDFVILTRYSTLSRTLRITVLCMRFANRCRRKYNSSPFITACEIAEAKTRLIKLVQKISFSEEIAALQKKQPIPRSSSILCLRLYLDEQQVLRVGGRLENAQLSHCEKHPPILPKTSSLSLLFVRFAHVSVLHAGLNLTLCFQQKHVWILRGRSLVKKTIRSCALCRRYQPSLGQQLMGQLPESRVTPSRPFQRSGVDYAGPIRSRTSPGRGQRSQKAYIALFICLSTKAIHIEVVSDLTTDAFLAAFRRFVARRGTCSKLLSDNGTTFTGADVELRSMFREASEFYGKLASYLAELGTHCEFIPPSSPHFGGLWESGVKSVKSLLRKTIGGQILTFEELSTVLTQVEACLNSRPLVPLSNDPSDISALTPAHFLVGSSLLTVPEPGILQDPSRLTSGWKLVQQLQQHFWRKWSSQYLHHLQQRSRWRCSKSNIQVGQLVLVHNSQLPPGKLPLGRVVALHPGADGLIRVVTVRTSTSVLRRSVTKLSVLPIEPMEAESSPQSSASIATAC